MGLIQCELESEQEKLELQRLLIPRNTTTSTLAPNRFVTEVTPFLTSFLPSDILTSNQFSGTSRQATELLVAHRGLVVDASPQAATGGIDRLATTQGLVNSASVFELNSESCVQSSDLE